jgi:exopolysaccharide biosynthesis polyprenyl glycosylphosphotransferase
MALSPGAGAAPARRRSHGPALWTLRWLVDGLAALASVAVLTEPRSANWVYAGVVLLVLRFGDSYKRRLSLSVLDDLPRLLVPSAVGLLLMGLVRPIVPLEGSLFSQAIVMAIAIVVGRAWSYTAIRVARRGGRMAEPALIIGAGAVGGELYRVLHEHREFGLVPVGILDDVVPEPPLPRVGRLADLEQVVHEHGIHRVIVAFGPGAEHDLVQVLRAAVHLDVEVHVVPRFFEVGLSPTGPSVEHVWGIPLYRVRPAAIRGRSWRVKRTLDVVVASAALLVLSPLLALLTLAVRCTSPGPVLFRQRRIGQHGSPIEVLKFRTLVVNDDSDTTWSVQDDPRQTSIGRWLRRLSLDELPQLWNVLRGEMTLIGPRPERPHFVESYSRRVPGYRDRHRLPVGLTGLSQVHGLRGDTSIAERARFDNLYIEHWSGWQDIKIFLHTVGAIVRDAVRAGDGAEASALADAEEQRIADLQAAQAAALQQARPMPDPTPAPGAPPTR